MVLALDEDDPASDGYTKLGWGAEPHVKAPRVAYAVTQATGTMVSALNVAATYITIPPDGGPFAVGFMGDDHRPRTQGWDAAYLDALRDLGTGIVYGDDLLQRQNLPTQCAMTADIIQALGYMAPPSLTHLYVDNFWLSLGRSTGCIRYLPDVVVEHCHPVARKAEWDAGYQRVNSTAMYSADEAAFRRYSQDSFAADVAKVKRLAAVGANG